MKEIGAGLRPFQLARLSLFQGCLGCLAVIFAGMLNRIMISELAFPALLVGGALAFEQLMAPARVLFGQVSDRWRIGGLRRTPYIWLGTAGFCTLATLSIPVIFATSSALSSGSTTSITAWVMALCGLFALYGVAISSASTPYLALVIDLTDEQERPRVVGIIWCMLTVGIIVGAIAISISTRSLDGVTDPAVLQSTLQGFMNRVALVIGSIVLLATIGIEPKQAKGKADGEPGGNNKDVTLKQSWALIRSSRQILIFFCFLLCFTLGLFLQDPILESYGAEVFGMEIRQSTMLNAFWGCGTLAGLLIAGLWFTPRFGKLSSARTGCWMILASLLLLITAGLTGSIGTLLVVMVLFGLSAGIGTNSALSLMLDLTIPQLAGTFVGVWGLAQAMSRALGKLMGGGLLDLGRFLSNSDQPLQAFSFVFVIEAGVVLIAIALLNRLNTAQFRRDTETRLDTLLMANLDD